MKKNILLIGGSHGIGLETVKILDNDHNVIVASRSLDTLKDLNVKHLKFDVLNDKTADLDLPERLDGLVYFPGSINLKPFKMLKLQDFEAEMQLNFFSLVKVVQALVPKLKKSENPSLVFFSSVAAKLGMPFHTSVAAAKAAVEGFAKALAAEYAPQFRVNVVAPSLTNTGLAGKILSSEDKKSKMDARHPLKRIGEPADIANVVVFLLSEKSSWMTGQIIGMDGGLSAINLS